VDPSSRLSGLYFGTSYVNNDPVIYSEDFIMFVLFFCENYLVGSETFGLGPRFCLLNPIIEKKIFGVIVGGLYCLNFDVGKRSSKV
jgi:hypothetical protein